MSSFRNEPSRDAHIAEVDVNEPREDSFRGMAGSDQQQPSVR